MDDFAELGGREMRKQSKHLHQSHHSGPGTYTLKL